MEGLTRAILQIEGVKKLADAVELGGCPAVISGVSGIHGAHIASAIHAQSRRPVFAVVADELEARRFAGDLSAFSGKQAYVLTGRDFTFYNAETVSRSAEQARLEIFYKLLRGEAEIVVATVEALLQRTMPPEKLSGAACAIELGREYDLRELETRLICAGYRRTEQVEGPGQFCVRGGILDFFSPAHPEPVRCELFGDEVDSMGFFDVSSQRRTEMIERADIIPASETIIGMCKGGAEGLCRILGRILARREQKGAGEAFLSRLRQDMERIEGGGDLPAADKYIGLIYDAATAADYIPPDAAVVMIEPRRLAERAKNCAWQLNEDVAALCETGALDASFGEYTVPWDDITEKLGQFALIMADNFTSSAYPVNPRMLVDIKTKQLPGYGGSLETARGDIAHCMRSGFTILVLCQTVSRAQTLCAYLDDNGIPASLDFSPMAMPAPGQCLVSTGAVSAGFEYPDIRLTVMTEGQLMAQPFKRKVRKRADSNRQKLESYTDLSPGDLVVHENYGIGRFMGIFKMPVDKVEKDYIKIAYAGTDRLYVPATQLDMVSKYIGGGEDRPVKLSKMGGTDWAKAKSRAKGAARELAKGLIELQARRRREAGYAFSPDSEWQREFEESFEYSETDDQLRSISEIKADMEKPTPMDRLLCGDVGYGKTEVALRAVMKCVMDGKQAAILVPTTVLAQQHYQTIMKRFAGYPLRVEAMSRFRSPAQLKKTVKSLGDGTVDIVIGTHRLLQKDVKFKDLGLLVVDEEQRFGVVHKERLKELARQVDVLTLSATPIPRTLNMALSGLRDMSTIEDPPQDRLPVQTYVLEHDWGIIADAIRREVSRGGQVYYLHNRVETIDRTAARLSGMIEGVSVGVAHGKMDEAQLGEVMEKMADGGIQVLVCTTIIETGIDIPNVNTLIIEDADRLGLAQLHQIRGRVGRSSRRAFAYFTFRKGKVLTEVAAKRLAAIKEFAEFNSGFKIAMRDLEIRGAGNLLGAEQSGHMMSVGYDMYLKLLEEAVLEEKGEKPRVKTECSADFTVSAHIPESYVKSGEQRMDLYRRIASVRTEEDADDITDELIDRFGDPPKCVNTLLYIAILRGEAADAGISELTQKSGRLYCKITDFDMEQISRLYSLPKYRNRIKIEAGGSPAISLKLEPGKDAVKQAVSFVRDYAAAKTTADMA